jgi:hypothetical protein
MIGRLLYVFDKVAWIATDVVRGHLKNRQDDRLGGYIPLQQCDDRGRPTGEFSVCFYTHETPPRAAYMVKIKPDVRPIFEAFDSPKEVATWFAALVQARQTAVAAMPATGQPVNPVVLPGEVRGESGTLVYLLAGTTKPNIAVFGKHFRALVPERGADVTYMTPLSNTILESPTRGPEGQAAESLYVTHLVTDCPTEIHVFNSLLTRLPVYVGTKTGIWCVEGDSIALVRLGT